jgi:hypothetical protein
MKTHDRLDGPVESCERQAPPADVLAERLLLASIFASSNLLSNVLDIVTPEHFVIPGNGLIFKAIQCLADRGEPVTSSTVRNELLFRGELDEIGGVSTLVELTQAVHHGKHAIVYAEQVRAAWKKREIFLVISHSAQLLCNPATSIEDVADRFEDLRNRLRREGAPAAHRRIEDLLGFIAPNWHAQIKETNFLINGWLPDDEYGILGAPPKTMKTRLAIMFMACGASGDPLFGNPKWHVPNPFRCHFLAGETTIRSAWNTLERIASAAGRTLNDYSLLSMVHKTINLGNEREVDRLKLLVDREKIKLLVLDPFYLFARDLGRDMNSMTATAQYLGRLTQLHEATGVNVLVVHHFPKSATRSAGRSGQAFGIPDLSWLAGAGCDAWARYYMLVNRRERFDETKKGVHKLWVTLGGESVEPLSLAVDVDEGNEGAHAWMATAIPTTEIIEQRCAERAEESDRRRMEKRAMAEERHVAEILAFLAEQTQPATANSVAIGVNMSHGACAALLKRLVEQKRIGQRKNEKRHDSLLFFSESVNQADNPTSRQNKHRRKRSSASARTRQADTLPL